MPDESCRTCGGELVIHALCTECRKPNQRKCRVCNRTTYLQSHRSCGRDSLPNQKHSVVQVFSKNRTRPSNKNSLRFSFLAMGIAGFFVLGLIAISVIGFHLEMTKEAQATDLNNISGKTSDSFPVQNGKIYDNCIAYGSGESITVICPTNDGLVYRGILKIPEDLRKEFFNSVFSIRGVSILENSDNSVTIEYHLKKYLTTYFGN